MALSKTISYNGVDVENAYIRVMNVSVSKQSSSCQVGFFATNKTETPVYVNNYHSNDEHPFNYDLNGKDAIAQAYGFLKTLPEFSGVTDA